MTIKNHASEKTHKDTDDMPVATFSSRSTLHPSDHSAEDLIMAPAEHIGLDHCISTSIDRVEYPLLNAQELITRVLSGQYFIAFRQVKTFACAVERVRDNEGKLFDEIYYPVPHYLRRRLCIPVRPIAFNACYSPAGPFIFAHKLDVAGIFPNSWHESITAVLSKARKGWVSVFPDTTSKRYTCWPVPCPFIDEPDYPGFEADLEKALAANIIDRLDHPVIQRILLERELIEDMIDLEGDLRKLSRL